MCFSTFTYNLLLDSFCLLIISTVATYGNLKENWKKDALRGLCLWQEILLSIFVFSFSDRQKILNRMVFCFRPNWQGLWGVIVGCNWTGNFQDCNLFRSCRLKGVQNNVENVLICGNIDIINVALVPSGETTTVIPQRRV